MGYENIKDNNPKKTVKLLASKLYQKKFKGIMLQTLEYHENIETDFKAFVELLCDEAKAFEKCKRQDVMKDKSHQYSSAKKDGTI